MSTELIEKKDFECPHCKKHTDIEIKKKEETPKVIIEETSKPTTIIQEHNHGHESQKNEETKFTHNDMSKLMPIGVNFSSCPGGNCGTKIKNQKITTKFKKCTNCNSNTVPKKSEFCPTCGREPEEWDESEVEVRTKEDEEEDE